MAEGADGKAVKKKPARAARRTFPVGAPCPNCGVSLMGAWCYDCGQKADDYHRSVLKLSGEAWTDLTDVEGRLLRTLPDLILRPGKLTRDYLDGHRARQVPPFRLFLTAVVILFLVGGAAGALAPSDPAPPPAVEKKLVLKAGKANFTVSRPGEKAVAVQGDDAERILEGMRDWSQTAALLSALILAPMVGLLFIGRRLFFFDHLIFSLHSLAFQGLVYAVIAVFDALLTSWAVLLALVVPVHLFVHLKGAYRLGTFAAAWRTVALIIGMFAGFFALLIGLVVVGIQTAGLPLG